MGLSRVTFLVNLMYHIFQFMNSKHLTQKRTDSACDARRSSILPENSPLWELLSFSPDVIVQNFMEVDVSECFNITEMETWRTIGVHRTAGCYFFAL